MLNSGYFYIFYPSVFYSILNSRVKSAFEMMPIQILRGQNRRIDHVWLCMYDFVWVMIMTQQKFDRVQLQQH